MLERPAEKTPFTALPATTLMKPAFFAICLAALTHPTSSPAGQRPNVLFIAVDDLRTNLGCYGDPVAITPNIDALAARGVRFTRAYAQQAVCSPSRQSLLTGRRPDSIRVWDLHAFVRQTAPDAVTLPEHFKLNGYRTQAIGKIYHDGQHDTASWNEPEMHTSMPKREDYRLDENRKTKNGGKAASTEFVDASEHVYPDGKVADAAVESLKRFAARPPDAPPFFLAVGFRKPHLPFTGPRKYWDLYDPARIPSPTQPKPPQGAPEVALHDSTELRGYTDIPDVGPVGPKDVVRLRHGYYAATSFTDAELGRVLSALEQTGLAKNTVIVFWSDHGFHLGEHGLWAKTTNYEADTRVPLIIVRPDDPRAGSVSPALVELLDIYPTLLDICGLPGRTKLEGQSLVPWLNEPNHPGRRAVFSQFPRPWMYRESPDIMGYAVRTETHRYIEWRRFGTKEVIARELYALAPQQNFETVNLANDAAQTTLVSELAGLLPADATRK